MRGAQWFSSRRSSSWSVNWKSALLSRPPTRMSWIAWRKRLAPATRASCGRRRAMTSSALSFRSPSGFSATNSRPVLPVPWLPPVNPATVSTAGSSIRILTNCASLSCIAWNDVA